MCSCAVWAQGFALELARTFLPNSICFFVASASVASASFASASLASACVMAVVVKSIARDQHARLAQICATWRLGDLTAQGTQIITMADGALDILREVGWVTQRVLPNNAVDALELCLTVCVDSILLSSTDFAS